MHSKLAGNITINYNDYDCCPFDITIGGTKYTFQRRIGFGGNGLIFEYCSENNKSIALKVFHGDEKEQCRLFSEELPYVNYTLDCIVPAIAVKEDNFIIMECMTGNLDDYLKSILKSTDYRVKIQTMLAKVCDIMLECYNKNIIHYDLKLANFLYEVKEDGELRIVLADFGGFVTLPTDIKTRATFPPITDNMSPEKNIVWMLVIMILVSVYNTDIPELNKLYETFSRRKISIEEANSYIEDLKEKNSFLAGLIQVNEGKLMSLLELCAFVKSKDFLENI